MSGPRPMKERDVYPYIFVTDDNIVHLMMPIVGGENGIGTDNTCEITSAIRDFFNERFSAEYREKSSYRPALYHVERYIADLTEDIEQVGEGDLKKQARLDQLLQYRALLQDRPMNIPPGSMPYKKIITTLTTSDESNCYGVSFWVKYPDYAHGVTQPFFKMIKSDEDIDGTKNIDTRHCFGVLLYEKISFEQYQAQTPLELAVKDVVANYLAEGIPETEQGIIDLNQVISDALLQRCGLTLSIDYLLDETTLEYLQDTLCVEFSDPKNVIESILKIALKNVQQKTEISFFSINKTEYADDTFKERLSLMTQFFLSEINIYCKENHLSDKKFSEILESDPHTQDLTTLIAEACITGNVEFAIFDYINKHASDFGLTKTLNLADQESIQNSCIKHFSIIKDSPHLDDFLILGEKPGPFKLFQGKICCDYAWAEKVVAHKLTPFIEQQIANFLKLNITDLSALPKQTMTVQAQKDVTLRVL